MTSNKLAAARYTRYLLLAALAAVTSVHAADKHPYDNGLFPFDPTLVEPWKETDVSIPAYPEADQLIEVPRNGRDSARRYLDRRSLSVGTDGVVRIVVVLELSGGGRNVFYEGVRCETGEYKTYAIGTRAGAFQPIKNPLWREIPARELNGFRRDLQQHHLCAGASARRPSDIVWSLLNSVSATP
jgi:hypothetical protein